MHAEERQQVLDEEHLRLLVIGYYIQGGMEAFFAFFPLVYVAMGILMSVTGSLAEPQQKDTLPLAVFGLVFAVFGAMVTLFLLTMAGIKILAARSLQLRRRSTVCLIAAGLSCLSVPWGTAIGICTFLVFSRPSVKRLFESPKHVAAISPAPGNPLEIV